MTGKATFEYTYCAPQQNDVRMIREKYLPKKMTKLDQLRALDASVTKRGNAVSIVHGTVFTLILGMGMSCCLFWAGVWFVPGVLLGCIGLAGVAATYPIYHRIVRQDREKIGPEILKLSEELMFGDR